MNRVATDLKIGSIENRSPEEQLVYWSEKYEMILFYDPQRLSCLLLRLRKKLEKYIMWLQLLLLQELMLWECN